MLHVGGLEVRQLILPEDCAARGDEDPGATPNAQPPHGRQYLHGFADDIPRSAEDLRETLLRGKPVSLPQVLLGDVLQKLLRNQLIAGAVPLTVTTVPGVTGRGCLTRQD